MLENRGDFLLRKTQVNVNAWNYVLSLRCDCEPKVGPPLPLIFI